MTTPLRLGAVHIQGGSERITRRPAQPRSNLERFKRGKTLASQLRESEEMSPAGKHRVWDAIGVEVREMLEELLGDSLVKLEKEQPVHESEAPSATVGAVSEPLEMAQ